MIRGGVMLPGSVWHIALDPGEVVQPPADNVSVIVSDDGTECTVQPADPATWVRRSVFVESTHCPEQRAPAPVDPEAPTP